LLSVHIDWMSDSAAGKKSGISSGEIARFLAKNSCNLLLEIG